MDSLSTPLFTRGRLVRLIGPLVVEQLLAMTIGMADTIMVTSAGEAAVSGISLVDSINLLLLQVLAALATGGAVLVSQYLGRGEAEKGRQAAKQLVYVSTLVGLFLMAISLIFRQQILILIFGHVEDAVMDSAMIYFLLTACSFPFLAVYNAGSALFRSMGNSKVSMFTSLLMNVINIGGNAVLIYGLKWGAQGAATSTLVSRGLGAIIMLALICRKKNIIHVEKLWRPEFCPEMLRGILQVGIPSGIENGMFQIGKLMVARLVTSFGTAAIAANAIANSVGSVINVPGAAIGLGLITVVGQCMGARQPEQAVQYTKKLICFVYLSQGILGLLLFFTAGPMVGLFNLSPVAAVMAVEILKWCAIATVLFWPLAFSLANPLRAAGDGKFTMIVSLLSMWIFRIGMSYLLAYFGFSLLGTWIAMFIDWFARAIVFFIRFQGGAWKNIRLIG